MSERERESLVSTIPKKRLVNKITVSIVRNPSPDNLFFRVYDLFTVILLYGVFQSQFKFNFKAPMRHFKYLTVKKIIVSRNLDQIKPLNQWKSLHYTYIQFKVFHLYIKKM